VHSTSRRCERLRFKFIPASPAAVERRTRKVLSDRLWPKTPSQIRGDPYVSAEFRLGIANPALIPTMGTNRGKSGASGGGTASRRYRPRPANQSCCRIACIRHFDFRRGRQTGSFT
jgi:hypothetical protein